MMEWNIQSRAHACQVCGVTFKDQQPYHTVLRDERAGYIRQDLCESCWSGHGPEAARRPGYISHWQGIYEAAPPQPELIRKDTAETLLRRLVQANDPSHLAAMFILAVMLERKRLLKVKEQVCQEGRRLFVYEQPRTGDVFTIADPGLTLDQLDGVQRDVAHLLEHGLPDPSDVQPATEIRPSTDTTAVSANPDASSAPAASPDPA